MTTTTTTEENSVTFNVIGINDRMEVVNEEFTDFIEAEEFEIYLLNQGYTTSMDCYPTVV